MVFVLNKNKKPLAPCHEAVARKLLKEGKAVVHRVYPFTIRLKELKDTSTFTPNYRLKIDYGSRHTGIAILKNDSEVIFMMQIHHRTDVKEKMDARRSSRRNRRNRKTRYRKPRFLNRKRDEDWLPPTLQSRVNNIETWIKRLCKLCPITTISYENVKFDTQKLRNPEISGVEYQQGTLQGYEVKEYLLEKFNRRCVYCGATNVPLEVEHIIPKSRGGTDRVDNLVIACHECNQRKGNRTAEEFGYPEIQELVKEPLKDCALVNATRWKIYEVLKKTGLPIECGSGGLTKMNRIKLGLPKDHHFDAICVGQSTPERIWFKTKTVLHVTAKGRGTRQMANVNKYGFPVGYRARQKLFFGFQTGDIVKVVVPRGKYKGTWKGTVACRNSGYFDIKDRNGKRIVQGISYKYCRVIQRFDGYSYELEQAKISGTFPLQPAEAGASMCH
ncbi:RNA-guided endonuclease IscB [Anaerocellum danielii]|uniref:RNA-guided endonuclease IscB n=1 Tax=Anaerocellum danielii TaxID=1387557 RepID=A0ABZ0TZJ8_9FIRM|nr:RNA-guided endonuclease IscB [Caldicellulosiruptor danielii]WPX08891.1 RNA-guided endonuclease IscB [Caldicellulosiruptor danielii]